ADHLLRRDVHQRDLVGRNDLEVAVVARAHQVFGELAGLVHRGRRLSDVLALLLKGREPVHVLGDLAFDDLAVRRLDEAVFVDAGEGRERRDEADVRTFRRLDRADAAVVRGVNVAHLEARALTGKTTRTERREATLVRDLTERVRLVQEMRELARTEILLDDR